MQTTGQKSHYDETKTDGLQRVGYDVLNQVPLLGTLVETLLRLENARKKDKFKAFVRQILAGFQREQDALETLKEREASACNTVFQALPADMESAKAPYYAFAFLFLVREQLNTTNLHMAKYVVLTVKALTVEDIVLVKEIAEVMDRDPTDKVMIPFFMKLAVQQKKDGMFLWERRRSIANLLSLGLLMRPDKRLTEMEIPLWTTEQFDVISRILRGLDMDKRPLAAHSLRRTGNRSNTSPICNWSRRRAELMMRANGRLRPPSRPSAPEPKATALPGRRRLAACPHDPQTVTPPVCPSLPERP